MRFALSLLIAVASSTAFAQDVHVRVSPDATTGIEETTAFPTIQMALDHHPFAGPASGKDGGPAQSSPYLPANFLRGDDHWNPEAEAAKLP